MQTFEILFETWLHTVFLQPLPFNPDIREDLLQRLDQEIMATQQRHNEVQRNLKQRRQATSYSPEEFENALHDEEDISPTTATPMASYQ